MSTENTAAAATPAATYELPVLRKDQKQWGSQKIDDAIKLKGIGEAIDGPGAYLGLNMLDNLFAPKITDETKLKIQAAVDQIIERDYSDAAALTLDYINEKIDIPNVSEATEIMAVNFLKAIFAQVFPN